MTIDLKLTKEETEQLIDILNLVIYMPSSLTADQVNFAEQLKAKLPEPYCHKSTNGYFGKPINSLML
jgi:hypothetical protein